MRPDLILRVNGRAFGGWESINVYQSIEQVAGTFELGITEKWASGDAPRPIHMGDACQVDIDGQRVITGYVDDTMPTYDAGSHGITVAGRAKTGDLVDCAAIHKSGEWKDRTLAQIARDLCRPFGVQVVDLAHAETPFKKWKIQEGETVFACLERAARIRGVLLTGDAQGDLVITRGGAGRIGTPLVLGRNILSAQGQFSHRRRFSQTIVKGDHSGSDDAWCAAVTGRSGTAADPRVTRYRPTIILAEDQVDNTAAKQRAQWNATVAFGRSQRMTYTVAGWLHRGGLWQPNKEVPVDDAWSGMEGDLRIAGVRFLLDDRGQRTEITVMPREAFDLIALPEAGNVSGWAS